MKDKSLSSSKNPKYSKSYIAQDISILNFKKFFDTLLREKHLIIHKASSLIILHFNSVKYLFIR